MRTNKIALLLFILGLGFIINPIAGFSTYTASTIVNQAQPNAGQQDDPRWYFNNLNATDRKKIRQALDMSIPRQSIIDTVLNGLGETLTTPIIPQHGSAHNSLLSVRVFNTTKALDLLEEVFGYRYAFDDNPNTSDVDETEVYFRLNSIIPVTNEFRSSWAGRISFAWEAIGVDVSLKYMPWGVIIPRILSSPIAIGFSYNHGGFDSLYIDQKINANPADVRRLYHGDAVVPSGDNYFWLDDPVSNNLITQSLENQSAAIRQQALLDWQDWFSDNSPSFIIMQLVNVFGADINLQGMSPYDHSNGFPNIDNWTITGQNNAVITIPAEFTDFNPILATSNSDSIVATPIAGHGGLLYQHVPDGAATQYSWQYNDYLATWHNSSADGQLWFFNLHENVKFSDGSLVTVDDIIFTYRALLSPATGASTYSTYAAVLNNNSFVKYNTSMMSINFTTFTPYPESFLILPALSMAQMNSVSPGDWKTDITNLNSGLLGYGPYTHDVYNASGSYLNVSQEWREGPLAQLPGRIANPALEWIIVQKMDSSSAALTALQTGAVDLVDENTGLADLIDNLNGCSNCQSIQVLVKGYEEVGFNQISPVWGVNPIDPRNMYCFPPASNSDKISAHQSINPDTDTVQGISTKSLLCTFQPSVSPSTVTLTETLTSTSSTNAPTLLDQDLFSGLVSTLQQYTTGAIVILSSGLLLGVIAIVISRRGGN